VKIKAEMFPTSNKTMS